MSKSLEVTNPRKAAMVGAGPKSGSAEAFRNDREFRKLQTFHAPYSMPPICVTAAESSIRGIFCRYRRSAIAPQANIACFMFGSQPIAGA